MIDDRLREVKQRFEDISLRLADPDTVANTELYMQLAKEHAELEPVVQAFDELEALRDEVEVTREMLDESDDAEMRKLAKAEIDALLHEIPEKEAALKLLLIPRDPLDAKNIILEIRAGTGGDEAALFAGDLFNMYCRFASKVGWSIETISESEGTMGGFKEVVAMIGGNDVYGRMKFEAGTHRVQRVPATESQGRVHTSACTVAVLPEAEDVDIEVNEADLRIDTYRASGAGGQHVNKTDSAIRITHIPTGMVVTSQDERSQHKNRAKAMKVLKSRLLDFERSKVTQERADARRTMVGSGDRSERIRTYNFPQNRITDHRISLTLYSLDTMISTGDLEPLVDSLIAAEQLSKLREFGLDD